MIMLFLRYFAVADVVVGLVPSLYRSTVRVTSSVCKYLIGLLYLSCCDCRFLLIGIIYLINLLGIFLLKESGKPYWRSFCFQYQLSQSKPIRTKLTSFLLLSQMLLVFLFVCSYNIVNRRKSNEKKK